MDTSFDAALYAQDFPILERSVHGKRLVYLDNGATSQKPKAVVEAITNYYYQHNANVHRGVHTLGDESTQLFHASRQTIADFFGVQPPQFIAVRNTTEAINQIVYTWGESHVKAGDVVVSTEMEHHSNLVPWQELCHRQGATLKLLTVDEQGRLNVDELQRLLNDSNSGNGQHKIKVITLTHVSNTLGTLNPIEDIVAMVAAQNKTLNQENQIRVVVDGAQAAAHLSLNLTTLGADFYVVSAHKMLGPMGIGGLFVKADILPSLPPFLFGGGMINEVKPESATYIEDLEERFTAGTPDVAGLVGWAAACEYLKKIGVAQALVHDQELVMATMEMLKAFPQIKVIGPKTTDSSTSKLDRVGSVAFVYQGVHAHDVGQVLDGEGVAVRSGHHCTMPLHNKFNWQATTRVSFQLYNTLEDIEALKQGLQRVAQVFGV